MSVVTNRFKAALLRGETQCGLWLGLANSYTAELCATAGFDWLLVDGEHAPNDLRSILAQLQAISPYASHPIVRPPIGETHLIKQLLDIGAQTLLIPMVESADQARRLVAAMHYPPRGIRGVGNTLGRASRWNRDQDYLRAAGDELCLLVQVESKVGLEQVDAIAAVPGVDGVFIGPSDLSAALGHLGNPAHPEVQAAIAGAIARIEAAGKASGILVGDDAAARHFQSLGCRFIAVGSDVSLLARAARDLQGRLRSRRSSTDLPSTGGDASSY